MFLGYWCKIRSEPRTPHACWLCPSINRCRCEALLSEPFGSQLMMGHSERERESEHGISPRSIEAHIYCPFDARVVRTKQDVSPRSSVANTQQLPFPPGTEYEGRGKAVAVGFFIPQLKQRFHMVPHGSTHGEGPVWLKVRSVRRYLLSGRIERSCTYLRSIAVSHRVSRGLSELQTHRIPTYVS